MAEFTSSRYASSSAGGAKFGNRDSTVDAGICKASSSKAQMNPDQGPSQAKHESEVQIADDEAVSRQEKNVGDHIQPSSECNQGAFQCRRSGVQLDTIGYKAMDKLKQRVHDVVSHKKKTRLLQTKIQALTEAIAEVEPLLSSGGNDPEDEVHQWFAKASDILKDSNGILVGRSNMAGRKRICRTCLDPTPSWEIGEMLREVERVMQDKENLDLASYSCGLFYCNKLQSRENQLQEILKALDGMIDADNQLFDYTIIGLAGMIGVGKTALARELTRRAQHNQLFDYTVMVQVSESVDVRSIQSQISKRIGLKLSETDDEETRAHYLSNALEQKTRERGNTELAEKSKILVIIDGLQDVINLVKVGITVESMQKREVVLLSRNPEICKKMGAEKVYPMECLDSAESKILFGASLKDKMQSMEITVRKYEYLENVMVMKCGGLPLIINSLACLLRSMSWYKWEILADQLLSHSWLEVDEVKEVPSAILELVNNFIRKGDEHKRFLLCCLILGQKGEDVPLEKLKRYGIGSGLFANDSFAPFHEWVHELKTLSLLLETRSQAVKINDIVHTVGVSALSQGENKLPIILDVGTSTDTREFDENCVAISMSFDSIISESLDALEWNNLQAFRLKDENCVAISMSSDSISESLDGLEWINLQAFRLKYEQSAGEWQNMLSFPDNLFQGMKNLKILEISCRSMIKVPSSIQGLEKLITLHLEKCDIQGETISTICKLDKLQVLSLRGCTIEVMPEEIGKLTNLRVLDLTICLRLRRFPIDVVAKMVRLQELYLDYYLDSFLDLDYKGFAWKTDDMKNLSSTTDGMSSDTSNFANLRRFIIRVIDAFVYRGTEDLSQFSRALLIYDDKVPELLKSSLRGLLPETEFLQIDQLDASSPSSILEISKDVFRHLKCLRISSSRLNQISEGSIDIYPQLKEVRLDDLYRLAPCPLPAQIAVRLRVMEVINCSSLTYIFPTEINGDTDGAEVCLEFPYLEILELNKLPSLLALKQLSEDSMKRDENGSLFNSKVTFIPMIDDILIGYIDY